MSFLQHGSRLRFVLPLRRPELGPEVLPWSSLAGSVDVNSATAVRLRAMQRGQYSTANDGIRGSMLSRQRGQIRNTRAPAWDGGGITIRRPS